MARRVRRAQERPARQRERRLVRQEVAAEYLDAAPRTLERWRVEGDGPPYIRLSARAVRYDLDAVDRWLAERERASTSDPGGGRPAA